MRIDYEKCLDYIKNRRKIKLYPYQEAMVRLMCDGYTVKCARGIGRSFVAKLIGEYVAFELENNEVKNPSATFPYYCAIEAGLIDGNYINNIKAYISEELFNKDFLCL